MVGLAGSDDFVAFVAASEQHRLVLQLHHPHRGLIVFPFHIAIFFEVIASLEVSEVNDISSAADIARQSIVDNSERSDNSVNFFNFFIYLITTFLPPFT